MVNIGHKPTLSVSKKILRRKDQDWAWNDFSGFEKRTEIRQTVLFSVATNSLLLRQIDKVEMLCADDYCK